ncbi:MAG: transglycosylase SLT domain-containing protein, partial [Bryobacteraceae bacterium]
MRRTRLTVGSLLLGLAWMAHAQDASSPLPASGAQFAAYANAATGGLADVSGTTDSGATDSGIAGLETGPGAGAAAIHSSETDDILARADKHFHTGRQLYFDGDLTAAHREFDAAIEVLLSAPDSLPDRNRVERRLDDLCDLIYRFDIEKLGSGASEEAAETFDKAPIDELSHMTFPVDPSLAPKVQAELHQTASGIPLDLTDPVLSSIHFFSTERGRRILLEGFQRSGKYRDMIQRIFAQEGVPRELIYLAQEESGFLPRAVSYKRAVGMWQFTAARAADSHLTHTSSYDARLDPEAST